LVTWFLVVFGDEVTKILCNSLLTFFTEQGKTGQAEIQSKENHATKMTKISKNEVTKVCNEPSFYICNTSQAYNLLGDPCLATFSSIDGSTYS
jgi:hypothetical protein